MILTVLYLSLCAAAVWLAAHSHIRDRRTALQIAMVLALNCTVSNSTWVSGNWWTWPVMDAATLWFVAVRHRRSRRPWTLGLMAVGLAQQWTHSVWFLGDKSPTIDYAYTAALNFLFVAQLALVSSSGVDRLGTRIRDYVAGRLDFGGARHRHMVRRQPKP